MPAILLSPLARWAVVALVLAGLAGWLWLERDWRAAAETRAATAERAVAGRDKAIAALERSAADAAARTARFQPVRRAVDAAPSSRLCAAAPAMAAALDGLRTRPAAAGGAADPAGVPAGAGGAGRAR